MRCLDGGREVEWDVVLVPSPSDDEGMSIGSRIRVGEAAWIVEDCELLL